MSSLGRNAVSQFLQARGVATSVQIQQAIGKSQPSVSRLLGAMAGQVITLGRGRSRRYAAPENIGDAAAQQPIWLIGAQGEAQRVGTLSLLARGHLHIDADHVDDLFEGVLPWYLSSLRVQGFMGRLLAQKLVLLGLAPNPEAWDLRSVLIAALRLHDAPGALLIGHGNAGDRAAGPVLPGADAGLGPALDALAADVAQTLPAGSSAGGEQPKFLAATQNGQHVLVKFSPPRGTPFGERWSDLLQAEQLCAEVLRRHGVATATSQLVQSKNRTYLLGERFDRIGARARRHVVALGAVHAAFVPGAYDGWAASCEALARQGRLSEQEAQEASCRQQFGRLIGNSDMHSANLGLFARGNSLFEIAKGRFTLAPSYDMLPMRWKPDPATGLHDYGPFDTDSIHAGPAARIAAHDFWTALAIHAGVGADLRKTASEMAARLGDELVDFD
jgi:hypothetical protein